MGKVIGLAFGLLLIVGCSETDTFTDGVRTVTISANIKENEQTRSLAADGGGFVWSKGDAIAIYTTSGSFREFTLNNEGGGSSANFTGAYVGSETSTTCAAYPYDTNHSISGNTLNFHMQSSYGSYLDEYAPNTNVPMIARFEEGSNSFGFRHIGGVFKFTFNNVPVDAAQFVFTATDKDITGGFAVDLTSAENPSIVAKELSTANNVTINFKPLTEVQNGMVVYVPLPTGTYNGFTLSIHKQDGTKLVSFTSTATNTLSRCDLTKFPELTFADVSGSIEQETGTLVNGVAKLAEAGTLATVLGDQMLTLTSLKVVGEINGTDVKCLRQMMGATEFNEEVGALAILDLSESSIVEGGDIYYNTYNTTKNVIGDYMFYCCKIVETITLPNNLSTISNFAFYYCSHLKNVTLPESLISIGDYAFAFCYGLQNINLPNSISHIGTVAFRYCDDLTSITIPTSLSIIEEAVFCDCKGITSITIPDNIETIKRNAFLRCDELAEISIGANVKEIGGAAFDDCVNLKKVNCYPSVPPSIGTSEFYNSNSSSAINPTLYVPADLVADYRNSNWGKVCKYIYAISN